MIRRIALVIGALGLAACQQGYNFDVSSTEDTFSGNVAYNNKVDLIFVVDNSASMAAQQQKFAAKIPAVVNALLSLKMDFHIAVISTSMGGASANGGRFLGSPLYMTNSTPGLVNHLTDRILLGESGSNLERGLESLQTTLTSTYLNGPAAGFWREDALFAAIVLSDEDDASGFSSTTFSQWLDIVKPPFEDGRRAWMFNFIGITSLGGACTTFGSHASPGVIFMQLAELSGGVKESICAPDLTGAVSNMRARIVQVMTEFPLKKKPDIATISVSINGVAIPRSTVNGWDYIAASNSVRFYGSAVPAADAAIRIDFKPAEAN